MATVPTRYYLLQVLKSLRSGKAKREDIAAWAMSFIDDASARVSDRVVWDVLANLGAVDLPSSDREYLYGDADFQDWAAQLEAH